MTRYWMLLILGLGVSTGFPPLARSQGMDFEESGVALPDSGTCAASGDVTRPPICGVTSRTVTTVVPPRFRDAKADDCKRMRKALFAEIQRLDARLESFGVVKLKKAAAGSSPRLQDVADAHSTCDESMLDSLMALVEQFTAELARLEAASARKEPRKGSR